MATCFFITYWRHSQAFTHGLADWVGEYTQAHQPSLLQMGRVHCHHSINEAKWRTRVEVLSPPRNSAESGDFFVSEEALNHRCRYREVKATPALLPSVTRLWGKHWAGPVSPISVHHVLAASAGAPAGQSLPQPPGAAPSPRPAPPRGAEH